LNAKVFQMGLIDWATRFKPFFSLYNLFQYNMLKNNIPLYKKWGIHKQYFSSISSKDFQHIQNQDTPWLDSGNSATLLPEHPIFKSLAPIHQSALLDWSKNGYAILPAFFSSNEVEFINNEIDNLLKNKKLKWKYKNKLMFSVNKSALLRSTANKKTLTDILSLLLGKKANLFQSINFYQGSQQAAHSDIVHMTTFPQGYLIACWIALEDVGSEQGPLFYYPESHKLPYFLNDAYAHGGNDFFIGKNAYKNYETALEKQILEKGLEKKTFIAQKGDVLIWHANLLHGGSPIANKNLTRKSMVMHYFAESVICYHEISQRPALIKNI
jgi:phytanoyl-CoA hydroxylase